MWETLFGINMLLHLFEGSIYAAEQMKMKESVSANPRIEKNVENLNFHTASVDEKFSETDIKQNRILLNKIIGENYLDDALDVDFRIVRFNPKGFPLKVYIENIPEVPEYYNTQVWAAFQRWQLVTGNFISFEKTDSPDIADIKVYYSMLYPEGCGSSTGGTLGYTHKVLDAYKLKDVSIHLTRKSCNAFRYPKKEIYLIALHEIGHSLGLQGHTSAYGDLMYPKISPTAEIGIKDVNTLKLIYSMVPDMTNIPLTEEEKQKLIPSYYIIGSFESRMYKAAIRNKSQNKDTDYYAKTFNSIANDYKLSNDYDNAIKNYLTAATFYSSKSDKAMVYSNISKMYLQKVDYRNALDYAYKACEISPTDENVYYVAYIYYTAKDFENAEYKLEQALNENPKNYKCYSLLADIYLKNNNTEKYKLLIQIGEKYFPYNPPVKKR